VCHTGDAHSLFILFIDNKLRLIGVMRKNPFSQMRKDLCKVQCNKMLSMYPIQPLPRRRRPRRGVPGAGPGDPPMGPEGRAARAPPGGPGAGGEED